MLVIVAREREESESGVEIHVAGVEVERGAKGVAGKTPTPLSEIPTGYYYLLLRLPVIAVTEPHSS